METLQQQYDARAQEERSFRKVELTILAITLVLAFGLPYLLGPGNILLGVGIGVLGLVVALPSTNRANGKLDEMRDLRLRIQHIHADDCPDDNQITVVDQETRVLDGGNGGPWMNSIPTVDVISQTTLCGACHTRTLIEAGTSPRLIASK